MQTEVIKVIYTLYLYVYICIDISGHIQPCSPGYATPRQDDSCIVTGSYPPQTVCYVSTYTLTMYPRVLDAQVAIPVDGPSV